LHSITPIFVGAPKPTFYYGAALSAQLEKLDLDVNASLSSFKKSIEGEAIRSAFRASECEWRSVKSAKMSYYLPGFSGGITLGQGAGGASTSVPLISRSRSSGLNWGAGKSWPFWGMTCSITVLSPSGRGEILSCVPDCAIGWHPLAKANIAKAIIIKK